MRVWSEPSPERGVPVTRRICAVFLLCLALAPAQLRAEDLPKAMGHPRPHVDLILVVDTSASMVGVGKGSSNIFASVKAAAKELVDWAEPGDNMVFISYDEKVRLQPTVAIEGAREKEYLKRQIDALKAPGKWTYTAAAIRDGVEEAARLNDVQKADVGGPHTKLVVLMTDGINQPPPYAKAGEVSLPEVAKRLSDMPWFVWQVQLGSKVDEGVVQAFQAADPERYRTIQANQATDLLAKVREQLIAELEKRLRRSGLRIEPGALSFGALQAGKSASQSITIAADPAGPTGHVRLRADNTPAGARVTFAPETVTIPSSGTMHAQATLEIAADAPSGALAGALVAELTDGSFELLRPVVTWSATVTPQSRALRVDPTTVSFGTIRPGTRTSKTLTLTADPGHSGGHVSLHVDAAPEGLSVTVEPTDVTLEPNGEGHATITLEAGPQAPAGARSGRLGVQLTEGALDLKTPAINWSATVEWPAVRLDPVALDFGRLRSGGRETRDVKLLSAGGPAAGSVRLRVEAPAGVRVTIVPEEITLRPDGEAHAQVTLDVLPDAAVGKLQGRIAGEVTHGAMNLQGAMVTWSARVPQSPLHLVEAIGSVLALLVVGAAGIWWVRRPRLRGTLRYWKDGTDTDQTVDLAFFGTRRVRVGSAAGSDIQLDAPEGQAAAIRAVRRAGSVLALVEPHDGSTLQLDGRTLSQLELYDKDMFSFAGYVFEYSGDVGTRPADA